uniref:Uncharacterized protein n=1 Tax=Onchocerca volvulus TaxID=6282 RepID=A0A8R1Y6X0_ONCVO
MFSFNAGFENDCCNNYDQTIISNNRLLVKHSLSAIENEKRKFSDHRASLSAENILNREVTTTIATAISNPFFPKSISANNFTKLLPTTSSSTGTMDDNNCYLQMKSVKQVTKSCTPILNSINGSENSQSCKNLVTANNYETNKYQNSKQFSPQLSQHATSKSFDPNRIIDDFMNDRYNSK